MDKNIISDLDNFLEEDKQRMSTMVDQLQFRDSLRMYNSLVERCFKECVNTFYRKSLTKQEETCVLRCAQKFLRLSMQVGLRFSDLNQGASTTDKGTESKLEGLQEVIN
ncbi:Mitochondrial import inner membrane translocase subunit Tim9 [Spatholobus suberectus]|nr:Mitochondrial import inner membrane translocase subunit Tim9 [Spatholobus suberectus]